PAPRASGVQARNTHAINRCRQVFSVRIPNDTVSGLSILRAAGVRPESGNRKPLLEPIATQSVADRPSNRSFSIGVNRIARQSIQLGLDGIELLLDLPEPSRVIKKRKHKKYSNHRDQRIQNACG
ncbi:MAG: hypothetical protein VX304_15180, partial [Planctomycetota bacterium]|nr:hypothetical protein [Planctomycetota bacterium]